MLNKGNPYPEYHDIQNPVSLVGQNQYAKEHTKII